jgi:hypothetical protein
MFAVAAGISTLRDWLTATVDPTAASQGEILPECTTPPM